MKKRIKNSFSLITAATLSFFADSYALDNSTARDCKTVALQGLDKINAKTLEITAQIGDPIQFESLKIVVRRCLKSGLAEAADTAVFVDIYETTKEVKDLNVYRGWMLASSPSLSTLEHPIYGIWVKRDQEHDKDTDGLEEKPETETSTEKESEEYAESDI